MATAVEQRTQRGDQSWHIITPSSKDQTIGASALEAVHSLLVNQHLIAFIEQRASNVYKVSLKSTDIASRTAQLEEQIARAVAYIAQNPYTEDGDVQVAPAYDLKDLGMASVIDVLASHADISPKPNRILTTNNKNQQPLLQTSYFPLNGIPGIRAHDSDWQLYLTESRFVGNRNQDVIVDEDTSVQMSKDSPPFHSLVLS